MIALHIPREVDGIMTQHLSNSLWPTNKLQDGVPEVLTTDCLSAKRTPGKLKTFIPLVVSTSLCARPELKESRSSVLAAVPALMAEVASSSGAMNEPSQRFRGLPRSQDSMILQTSCERALDGSRG